MASNIEQHVVKTAKEKTTTDLIVGRLNLGPIGSLTSDGTSLGLKSFRSADKNNIILANGKSVPVLPALEELQIKTNKRKEFNQDQVVGLLSYARHCQRLKKLSFIDCLLPLSLLVGPLSPISKLRHIQVSWTPAEHGLTFHLDSFRGKWVSNSKEAITLETKGQNSLRLLCSSIVYLRRTDSKQLQMSTILLLEIASSHNIPIPHLYLEWSFSGFDGKDIRLEFGLCLSSLSSVEKISINAGKQKKEFTEEDVTALIQYVIKSPRLKELWLDNCKLPSSINPDIIPEESRSRNIKVISSNEARYLDLISGQWRKPDDIQSITEMCSDGLIIHRDTSESVQKSVIELLVEASNHDIPIYSVTLAWSFREVDEDGNMILSSGLSLPIITSIENMGIQTESGREMNTHEVNGILNYVQHSQRFKELDLGDCLLPSLIPIGPSLSTLKSRRVEVFWIPDVIKFDERYKLDLDSGRWGGFSFLQGYDKPYLSEFDTEKELQDVPASSLSGSPVPSQSADVPHPKKRRFDDSTAAAMLNYTRLKDTLTELLSNNDCHQLASHVALPTDQLDAIINSNSSTKDLLDVLEERGVIHSFNVSRLLKAISVLKLNKTALFMLESYQRSIDQVLSKSMMINKEGGILDVPCTGASLEIPSGALEEEQFIQMIIIPPHLESESLTFSSNSSLVVELLPSNVNLLKPAILTLPHCLVLKKGCEWKAKIYRSHHKEGSEPQWEEQFNTYYKLGEHNCVIEIQRFSWEKIVVRDKIVEAKNIIVYAAGRCGPTDSMYLDIGYYWDLATCEKVSKMNNANLLHEKRTIFYKDGKCLNISLEEFKPKNWTCSNEETKTQVISFDQVAINKGTFRTFELDKTNGTDACTCHFKAGQSPNLEDYTFLLKAPDPSSVTQLSTTNRQEAARAGRSTAGIPAPDRVVTYDTLKDLSQKFCREWMIVGRELGIGEPTLQAIDIDNKTAQEKVHEMLLKWKQSKGNEATYRLLGEALKSVGRKDLQEYLYQQDNSQEGRRSIREPIYEDERPSDVERTPTERHVKNDGLSIPEGESERAIVERGRGQSINILKTERKKVSVGRGRGRGQSKSIMKSRERASVGRGRGQAK